MRAPLSRWSFAVAVAVAVGGARPSPGDAQQGPTGLEVRGLPALNFDSDEGVGFGALMLAPHVHLARFPLVLVSFCVSFAAIVPAVALAAAIEPEDRDTRLGPESGQQNEVTVAADTDLGTADDDDDAAPSVGDALMQHADHLRARASDG